MFEPLASVSWACFRVFLPLPVAAMLCFGCGGSGEDGPQTVPVSGLVTWEGAPVDDGDIAFVPAEPSLAQEGGRISEGHFEMQAKPGKNTIRITASRVVPGQTSTGAHGEELPVKEQFIPAKYNSSSELTVEVSEAGPNEFSFNLTEQ